MLRTKCVNLILKVGQAVNEIVDIKENSSAGSSYFVPYVPLWMFVHRREVGTWHCSCDFLLVFLGLWRKDDDVVDVGSQHPLTSIP